MKISNGVKIFLTITVPFFIVLHFLGWWRYYYTTTFYDKTLHILAGAAIVVFIYLFQKQRKDIKNIYVVSIIVLAIIGIVWEIFEYIIDHTLAQRFSLPPLQLGTTDALLDFAMDIIGGLIFLGFIYMKNRKN